MTTATQVPVYWEGKLVRFSSTVRDYAGALTNSPVVVLTITHEVDGTATTPAVTNTGAGGVYYADVVMTPGPLVLDWVSSGAVVNADEDRVYGRPRRDLRA